MKIKVINNVDLDDLNLSVRAWNCLRRAKIDTVQDIVDNYDNLNRVRNLGERGCNEVLEKIKPYVEISTNDKQRKHAEWHGKTYNYFHGGLNFSAFMCSNCKKSFAKPYNYCGNCGAKMDGGTGE